MACFLRIGFLMSINMRFAPDLVLRNFSEHLSGEKHKEECVPQGMKEGACNV